MKAESVSQGGVNTTMKVFISYSRKDKVFVERLKTALEAGKVGCEDASRHQELR